VSEIGFGPKGYVAAVKEGLARVKHLAYYPVMQLLRAATLGLACISAAGCATLQQIAALRSVDFQLARVANVRIAGIDASSVSSYSDLRITDAARVAAAIARRELPLSFQLHVQAENPADNPVTARLVRMQWTLLLEDTETISGLVDQEMELPPGQPRDIPVAIALDLFDFFERSGPDLFNLALNLMGAGNEPSHVALRAMPTVNTTLGPIQYPQPITIVDRKVGGD
jgi:hypothetical protein